jgi:hypothetical protein
MKLILCTALLLLSCSKPIERIPFVVTYIYDDKGIYTTDIEVSSKEECYNRESDANKSCDRFMCAICFENMPKNNYNKL